MPRKTSHYLAAAVILSFFLAAPLKANAANYQLVRKDTTMSCVDTETGTPVRSRFITVKGYTYYFNDKGFAQTGWMKYGKDYYFFDANGAMKKKEWVNQYYFKANGKMATNKWITKNIYVGPDGRMIPGYSKKSPAKFITSAEGTRYQNPDGSYARKTWMNIKKHWYYFYPSGLMAKNRQLGLFYVDGKGRMVTNKVVRIGNVKYFYGSTGQLVKTVKPKKTT